MNRKPIFDAVRKLCGGRLSPAAVKALDAACDEAEAATRQIAGPGSAALQSAAVSERTRPGAISKRFESGSGGPGTVSSGTADPGGVSYGTYQLSTNAGTLQKFMVGEGKRWAGEFGTATPGTAPFSAIWKDIARREPTDFGAAQHDFIHRTHYLPALKTVEVAKGLALDSRHDAVREASWSVCVQHRRSADILIAAINAADPKAERAAKG